MKPYSTSAFLGDYLVFLTDLLFGRRFAAESAIAEIRNDDTEKLIPDSYDIRVLDLANGHLRPQSTLLSAAGYEVVGIDFANLPVPLGIRPLLSNYIITWRTLCNIYEELHEKTTITSSYQTNPIQKMSSHEPNYHSDSPRSVEMF